MIADADALIGESWAYRAHWNDPLVEVVVLKLGVKRPERVLVRFVADEFEGRQEWVPPKRLKCRWEDRQEFLDRERRWDAVAAPTPRDGEATVSAAGIVFDLLITPEVATVGYNATEGVTSIRDVPGLCALLLLSPEDLRGHCVAFEEDGGLIVPWDVTLLIARRATERDPHAVLRYVEREEADARHDAINGRYYPSRGGKDWHVTPEICTRTDEEHGQPVRAVLRLWSGQEPLDLRREIYELRGEAIRLGTLANAALETLMRLGHTREADRLEREARPVAEGSVPPSGGI